MRSTIPRRTARPANGMAAAVLAAALFAGVADAKPFRPANDTVVLERLSPAVVALRRLRGERPPAAAAPGAAAALAQARRYIEIGRTWSDPRAYGYAQAALGPWWTADPAPAAVLVMRARILQFRHEFDTALVQLEAALQSDQFDPDAWLLFAGIEQVRGNARAARAACLRLLPISDPLIGATCVAATAALEGRREQGVRVLTRALEQPTASSPAERAWAWTTLAELHLRGADAALAEKAFRRALALVPDDVYARAAYADMLLDAQRTQDARRVLGDDPVAADAILLRSAIAAQREVDADAGALRTELGQRFAEARARGDRTHLREQARFELELRHDATRALELAQRNFAVQREPADARVLFESALAAHDASAAAPALAWLRATGIESVRLQALARRASAQVRR
jgi:Tfp pilus assembly protein PilF